MEKRKSIDFFHRKPENYNCAQSILKGFQEEFGLDEGQVEEFRAMGGGRSPKGLCGAVYSADYLMELKNLPAVSPQFEEQVGALACREIKGNRLCSCQECIEIAHRLVEGALKSHSEEK